MEKNILLIEDDPDVLDMLRDLLGARFKVFHAETQEEAHTRFGEIGDRIAAIAMDGHVPGGPMGSCTVPLTRIIRARFQGPMIAISTSSTKREELMRAGCDHECEWKADLSLLLPKIL